MTYIIKGDTREYNRVADRDSTHYWLQPADGSSVQNGYGWGGNALNGPAPLALAHKRDVVNLAGKVLRTMDARTKSRDILHNIAYLTPGGTIAATKGRDEYTLFHVASGMSIPTETHTGHMYAQRRVSRTKTLRDTKLLAVAIEDTNLIPDTDDTEALRNADYKALKAFLTAYGTSTEQVAA